MNDDKQIEKLMTLSLSELRARYAKATGKQTKCPNKKWLARQVVEAGRATKNCDPGVAPKAKTKNAAKVTKDAGDLASLPNGANTPLAKLSVDDLRALYAERIGRETRSTDARYLQWKLRQAAKGRVPMGPRQNRRSDAEFKVLPLRMDAAAIEKMDAAWRELGIKTRTEFLRQAIGSFLDAAGKREAAAALRAE